MSFLHQQYPHQRIIAAAIEKVPEITTKEDSASFSACYLDTNLTLTRPRTGRSMAGSCEEGKRPEGQGG